MEFCILIPSHTHAVNSHSFPFPFPSLNLIPIPIGLFQFPSYPNTHSKTIKCKCKLSTVEQEQQKNKKLSYRRVTARCVLSVVISPITTQQCRNYLYDGQVLTKPMVWSWRFSCRQCVINKPTTVELCISPVYRRLDVAKFFKIQNVEIAHVTLTTPT